MKIAGLSFGEAGGALRSEGDVRKMVAKLPADAPAALKELVFHAAAVAAAQGLDAGARARVLLELDAAVHACRERIVRGHLAPNGAPAAGRDIAGLALRPLLEAAEELARGLAAASSDEALKSAAVQKVLGPLLARRAAWLGCRFALMYALRQSDAGALWREAHAVFALARKHDLLNAEQRLGAGGETVTSVRHEYVRLFLLDIAGLEALRGREIELAWRIAGRFAPQATLQRERSPGACYGIVPQGDARPLAIARLDKASPALHLDTSGCTKPLRELVARGLSCEGSDPDPLFDKLFTTAESIEVAGRLLERWGAAPPQRRSQRVALDTPVKLRSGLQDVLGALAPLNQGEALAEEAARATRRLAEKTSPAAKGVRETAARLVDGSTEGMGVLVPRVDASWARIGLLVAVYIQAEKTCTVGVLRRIGAQGDQLRLGIGVLARQPRTAWLHVRTPPPGRGAPHEERGTLEFFDFYRQALLLGDDPQPGAGGALLVVPGAVAASARLELPRLRGVQHLDPGSREDIAGCEQIGFEVSGETRYPKNPHDIEPDAWSNAQ
jgi:hypothetical protein